MITARAITVTAVTDTKGYDGTTSSVGRADDHRRAAWPAATPATLHPDVRHRSTSGTGKTLTPGRPVTDGNGGGNYTVTFATDTTGVITARAITVTAVTDTKGYDGTTSSAGVPTITSGSLATGDTATFTQTFDTAERGHGQDADAGRHR